jgi:glycine hydroxymethyltransferase
VKVIARDTMPDADGVPYALEKAYFIGCRMLGTVKNPNPLPAFEWQPERDGDLKKTPLNALHRELGANMVDFGGWEMPVKYGGAREEHLAVRQSAGVFDVAHMGIFELSGSGAEAFLNAATTNDVSALEVGKAQYGYLLAPDGACIDDIMLYRLESDRFMMVVNASNNDKDWAWLKALREGRAMIDPDRPWAKAPGRGDVTLRDLRAESAGDERRVDIALQGPNAREVLFKLGASDEAQGTLKDLGWAGIACVEIGDYDLIVTRTGYTGERIAYELFIHPDRAADLFKALVEAGAVPCGLAARDSLRIEAGLPLYGHELDGPLALGPADAGFAGYVKLWKPFFVGKAAYLAHEAGRESEIVRFGVDERGGRPPNQGDPVVDRRGRVVGTVTSCSMDTEGRLIGMAYVKEVHAKTGTSLGVFALGGRPARESKPLHEIGPGDRVTIHQNITVLSRFPK